MFKGGISFSGMTDNSDDIPGIGQYEDFHTIDWQRDIARDRMHHRYIVKKKRDSFFDLIKVSNLKIENLNVKFIKKLSRLG